jgi:hypothetical protein
MKLTLQKYGPLVSARLCRFRELAIPGAYAPDMRTMRILVVSGDQVDRATSPLLGAGKRGFQGPWVARSATGERIGIKCLARRAFAARMEVVGERVL